MKFGGSKIGAFPMMLIRTCSQVISQPDEFRTLEASNSIQPLQWRHEDLCMGSEAVYHEAVHRKAVA